MRQPLEDGVVRISRNLGQYVFRQILCLGITKSP
ncbi:MAG: hypothetical protein ACLTSZ_11685 [Lachnospiraceae bacterium]